MDTWRADFAGLPAFHHLTPWINRISGAHWTDLAALNALAEHRNLRNALELPVRFAPQTSRCGQHEYEIGIYRNGQVPSRERNWHDLFNALTWLAFPATKAALNAVHHAVLPQGKNRTPASDAATLFDESGLVLVGEDESLAELLAARRWRKAFVLRRNDWRQVKAYVVGHAILEKLLTPWPGITAKCLFVKMPADTAPDKLDSAIAERWRATASPVPAELFPVPVLGLPGWWPANEKAEFYADTKVFRP
ncbi:MAG: hypothetical protein B7Y41_03910 [Hydrogenophilales bacterium 28-61-23]|nr:MAG: hypothetical protein B7Y41_03910 [Hydrogenophilales bacterium 28-61-23]